MENNYRGNMTLPKNLQEKRDELSLGRAENFWGERDSLEQEEQNSFDDIVKDYKKGFNDCANLLLPEIKRLEEALEWYATKGEGAYSDAKLYLRAESALKSLREFLGEL